MNNTSVDLETEYFNIAHVRNSEAWGIADGRCFILISKPSTYYVFRIIYNLNSHIFGNVPESPNFIVPNFTHVI